MALIVIDMQEKLAPHIEGIDQILKSTRKLVKAMKIFGVPVIATEQIKLGRTVDEIGELLDGKVVEKTTFSCFRNDEFRRRLEELSPDRVMLTGIETHICVLQTALDLKNAGYDVYVVADCTGSRRGYDRDVALMRMRDEGVKLTTSESLIYEIMESAEHPAFKDVLKIVKE